VRRAVALAAAVLLLSACEGASVTPPPVETRVDVDTPALRAAKAEAGVEACPSGDALGSGEGSGEGSGSGSTELPEVTLPCLGGGRAVDLTQVEGPAVLPLWASWCKPCRKELPLYQLLAERAGDEVTVIGVDYQDTQPDVALELLQRTGATFPQLADPGGAIADTFRVRGLPSVMWVREDGSVTLDNAQPASYDDLVTLVSDRLGVDVAPAPAG